jgi:hypothetical protein
MPSRGSPIVRNPSKPNVEESHGITADAESEQARTTDAPTDRKPDRATLGFSRGATQTGVNA